MDNTRAQPLAVRRAAAPDAAALTRLREVMLSDMGMLAVGADPGWRARALGLSPAEPVGCLCPERFAGQRVGVVQR
jgi:hypothetical protein